MNNQEYHQLGKAITALQTPYFTSQLIDLLKTILPFDCAVILGYRQDKHPIYLYDSIPSQRQLLFQHYLTHTYLQDPFYTAITLQQHRGILHRSEFSQLTSTYFQQKYHADFYQKTGWQDEVAIAVNLDETRWIGVYLGILEREKSITAKQLTLLKQRFSVLEALCRQHWGRQPLLLAENGQAKTDIRHWVEQAINQFGAKHLTPREQQITSLLVQGLDSQEIAQHLNIAHGTVKNHRKHIYAQLNVSSLSELFQLFLNYLIASAQ
ncbi:MULTISPECIES: LuxR C-terminal-related transcriptional regulator [Vibrio]|uniref:LuxR C-terminal-related transcriptional regulator n=1 Tax=Vibrio TaxID=662 RepID=UPI000C17218B|nr:MULTISPECIES: LuxR C-terminal-related transcriptional regulator [Vibrio]NNN44943.1 LuxR family transcriptional regulator [Vibrio sp. 1-1(7)]NNN72316.1 LuxR family transcriptional regulator [Vibrio sp. 12-2(3-a)]